ncbi:hypothetical protein [Streptomyces sp. NBC_00059]|uniref:hypothetical protein n=1 Tax=Streptomyces sp. NBC_00059 TaxID=2975635 RepID=UPI002259AE11|nr:hypothetical protein [Streptomyces sp. NBC_00059]MCX5411208.1 hypothetical protein [Streptomyces sp. NBC_00059]
MRLAFGHQLAATWLEIHPGASASQVVEFLEAQSLRARLAAVEVYVATGKTSEEEALALLEHESRSYRDLMRNELSTGELNLPASGAR